MAPIQHAWNRLAKIAGNEEFRQQSACGIAYDIRQGPTPKGERGRRQGYIMEGDWLRARQLNMADQLLHRIYPQLLKDLSCEAA